MEYLDLRAQYRSIRAEVNAAIARVLESQHFILGPEGKELEREIAAFCGTPHAVGCNSGTDALELVLRALNIGDGDDVVTTPFTFIATAEIISLVGARPVFADVDDNGNLNPKYALDAVTPRTKAVIVVHLYGMPADMKPILEFAAPRGLAVIEDLAQAIGATYNGRPVGSIGDFGCISFFPAKNLGAYGDAGMVVTRNTDVAKRIRSLRNHGSEKKYVHDEVGTSSRLDDLQAAILRAKLPFLNQWNAARQKIAGIYSEQLKGVRGVLHVPHVPEDRTCVFQQYTIHVEERDRLVAFLAQRGIPTAVHYPKPLHLQTAFRSLGYAEGDFPHAEWLSRSVLSLPCYPEMPEADIAQVIDAIRDFALAPVS